MSIESALTFFIAIFLFGVTPGPGVFAILARSMIFGAKSSLPLAAGMAISDIVYLILACLGLATVAQHWESVFTLIRYIGAAYLMYLGYKLFTSPIDSELSEKASSQQSAYSSFLQGFLISASNPKVILFYIAFLPTFIDVTVLSEMDVILVTLLTFVALMLALMLIATTASTAKKHIQSHRGTKRLNQSAGSIMAAAGIFLLTRN